MSTASQMQPSDVIRAAGGILLRKSSTGEEQVCIVLRKLRKDWTLPKGKFEEGESLQQAALREVQEETGWACHLCEYMGAMGYEADGQPKVVLFWRMEPVHEGVLNRDEIKRAEWMSISDALARLTYKAEKDFLSRITGPAYLHMRTGYSLLDRIFQLRRARARLARGCDVFSIELDFLEARCSEKSALWAKTARQHLFFARQYEKVGEVEGGWLCLHAAQRWAIFGLDPAELLVHAESIRYEAKKLHNWRAEIIQKIVGKEGPVSAEALAYAMEMRDEFFANRYHKVWLTGDQLGILIGICLPALLGFVLLAVFRSSIFSNYSTANSWNGAVIAAVIIFGTLGASFSCAQSLISNRAGGSIPERVADHYITITRVLSGAVVGLASFVFYICGILPFKVVDGSFGVALAVAFIFGYTGEKLVARVISKEADKNSKAKAGDPS